MLQGGDAQNTVNAMIYHDLLLYAFKCVKGRKNELKGRNESFG